MTRSLSGLSVTAGRPRTLIRRHLPSLVAKRERQGFEDSDEEGTMAAFNHAEPLVAFTKQVRRARAATLVGLTLATAAEYWTSSGVSLVLTDLTGTLSASSDEASWALTVYTTAFAVAVALSHSLSLRFGNRRYLAACALLYASASIGCALSSDLEIFLVFRALQGFAGGAFLIRSFVFLAQQYEPRSRQLALVAYGISFFAVGRFAAPIVCGWLADVASWRLLFGVEAILMLAAALLFFHFTEEHWTVEVSTRTLDYPGVALLILGASTFQAVLSRGEIDGWFDSPVLASLFAVGVFANLCFTLWQLSPRNKQPLLHLAALRDRSTYASAVLGFALGILLAGSLYVLPLYLRGIETHSAYQTGVLLSIGGGVSVLVLCGFSIVGVLVARLGGKTVIALSLLVEMTSQLLFAHFLTTDTPNYLFWVPLALNGVFIALSVPVIGIVAFGDVKDSHISNVRALYYSFRQLGASVGVTCAAVLIDRRMTFHSSRLLDALATRNLTIVGPAVQNLASSALVAAVRRQSAVLSYADVFLVMSGVAFVTLLLVPLLPAMSRAPAPQPTPASATSQSSLAVMTEPRKAL